jgi:hypothetical protein
MNRSRESGAFLLGTRTDGRARIASFVLYDDLDPHCLDTGIVRFDGRHFGALWDLCKQRKQAVVADIHVHPDGSYQSGSDRDNPMISRAAHVALILPRFGTPPVDRTDLGIYVYEGGKQWQPITQHERKAFFHIGF